MIYNYVKAGYDSSYMIREGDKNLVITLEDDWIYVGTNTTGAFTRWVLDDKDDTAHTIISEIFEKPIRYNT